MPRDPIIEAAGLVSLSSFRLLDVRDIVAFEAGHQTKATRVPIEVWEAAAKAGETSFENVTCWEDAISGLGVDGQVPVVICDDGCMTEAARVWFILQYFGAEAFILNGGWPALEGQESLLTMAVAPSGATTFRARPGSGMVGLVDRHGLQTELGGELQILDARTESEFDGNDLRRNLRGGHVPGARLLPHLSLLEHGLLKSAEDLRDLLAGAGFRTGGHVVTHCDGGGPAALAAAARAGYGDVRAYYLSFADWAQDESCPIVRD